MQETMRAGFLWMAMLGSVGALSPSASAQQLKPYFLVIADTSSSMEWCAAGQSDCGCHVGGNCSNAFFTNACDFPANRIGDAKCALQRIVDSAGDATFGLMQFQHACSTTCGASGEGTCDADLLVPIQSSNETVMREWVDGTCAGQNDMCVGGYARELVTGLRTPVAKSLERANEYLRGTATGVWPYPTNPAGASVAPASPITGDSQLACRPVSVILLTDGNDTCESGGAQQTVPPMRAATLYAGALDGNTPATKAIRTYVIGFGTGGNFDPDVLNAIAIAGGTDSPDPTHRYFPAANEAELSLALNQIIADAQPPVEICNDADDDCDGEVDEGIQKYCDKPNGTTALALCTEPIETECDGADDDCDGKVDEDFPEICSTCTMITAEVCDGVDNDCDTRIDEGASSQDACGSDTGACEEGELICIDGQELCQGGIGPKDEACNCEDDDCDGVVDEDDGAGLCGAEQRCAGCQCVPFCQMTAEFTASCPDGLAPEFQANGECLCVVNGCDAKACMQQTLERDGKAACAPNDALLGPCVCSGGQCAPRCDGVACSNGQICSPKNGRCVEDNCRGLGCAAGQICEPLSGECMTDACETAGCAADQLCRSGKCEKSCANVACNDDQVCKGGACVTDPCKQQSCDAGKTCNPADGQCVDNLCLNVSCAGGQVCDVVSGECEAGPCWNVTCPSQQMCSQGECISSGGAPPSFDNSSASRVLATGGGGCACSVPGPRGATRARGLGLGLLLALGVLVRRRRKSRAGSAQATVWHVPHAGKLLRLGVLLACAWLVSGCRVSPFCVDCTEPPPGGGLRDGQVQLPDGRVITPGTDGGAPGSDGAIAGDGGALPMGDGGTPGCADGQPEICNDKDDDCDFKVDEGVAPTTNDCLQVGVCAGTLPTCAEGKFVCRYPNAYEKDETRCDGQDNDCDQDIDETFPALGESCVVGVGECRVAGSRQCNTAGADLFCEAITPKQPMPELCNGKDDDCDGLIDEPMSNPGSHPSYVTDESAGTEVCNGKDDDCDGLIDEPKSMPGSHPSYVQDDVAQLSASLWIYKYEASRPDATDATQGSSSGRACSRADVLPWTNLTYADAQEACEAADMQLCTLSSWLTACEGSGGACEWAYTPTTGSCNDYSSQGSTGCNGHDVSAQPGDPDEDALLPTGSKERCFASHGGSNSVFDLSGNAKEWTTGAGSPAQNPLRGGSYNNSPVGLRCDFDFSVGGPTLRLPNVGFRCCSATAP